MGYVDDNLVPGERVAHRARPHWSTFAPFLTGGPALDLLGVGLIIGSFIGRQQGAGPVAWMLISGVIAMMAGGAWFAMGIVLWRATEITVTTRRVFIKTGIVRRHTTEILLAKVESVAVEETLAGRMLGYGRVTIHGTGGTPGIFERLDRPHEFRRQVQIQIEALPHQGWGREPERATGHV